MPVSGYHRGRSLVAHARLAVIAFALFALLASDPTSDLHPPPERTLVVAVLAGPASALRGAPVAIEYDLIARYAAARGLGLQIVDVANALELFAKVAAGEAHIGVGDAAVTRSLFGGFDMAFALGPPLELAWAVAPNLRALREDIDRFFAAARSDGLLARLAGRYMAAEGELERIDAATFQDRLGTMLPRYQPWFEEAAARTGLDWRLVAAVAYQESQWDPAATSETGVRGFMQITEETAQHLGIADRLDPYTSILGAARYLAALKARLPARIAEPDRTWFALAAFNIGAGHLEDARVLAQRQKLNPDRWDDVRQALPLLALPEHYDLARNGYARGGMPVVFVDRVRAFNDILVRQLPSRPQNLLLAANP